MKNFRSVLWGIVLVIIGIILSLNALDIADIDLFFDGWWTLFIIVPCAIDLFNENESKTGNVIGLIIGTLLLLACQDVLDFGLIWKLFFPLMLVAIGLTFIFKNTRFENKTKNVKKNANEKEYMATFSGQKFSFNKEVFKGCTGSAIFGGLKFDLVKAIIEEDIVMNVTSIFGGIDIIVPDDVNIVVNSTSIFGGVENKVGKPKDFKHTIYINATCLFGGVEIK